jgi:RNA polymerase sigma factor (sigma-70 family)
MVAQKQLDDTELVKMITQNDQAMNKATTYILQHYGQKVKNYIFQHCESMEEAEDALYEGIAAFIMNVRKGSFKGDSTISSYLISISRNIWHKKYKRMKLHKNWEEGEIQNQPNRYEENVLTDDLKKGLDILLGTLKVKCRNVLHLWAMSYSMEEITEKLGISSPQVAMNKKNLCLKELRNIIAEKPQLANLVR